MTTAFLTGLGMVGKAFGSQTRPEKARRPEAPTSTALVAAAPTTKQSKLALKNAREERLYNLLTQPEVIGLATVFAALFLANKIPFSDKEPQNSALQSIAASGGILMGLGHAGVGDLTTLTMAGIGGAATFATGLPDAPGGWFDTVQDFYEFLNKYTPLGWILPG